MRSGWVGLLPWLHRMMADRLDAVAVGVAKEGGVIGGVITAQSRRSVIGAAGRDAGIPERIDLALPARLEAPVAAERFFRLRPLADRDVDTVRIGRPRPFAIAEPVLAATDLDHAECLHDGVVERLGRGDVGDGDGNVVEHGTKSTSVVIASEAKQSSFAEAKKKLDCFVAALLAMTVEIPPITTPS